MSVSPADALETDKTRWDPGGRGDYQSKGAFLGRAQMLSEMDGFETKSTVVVMAATNRRDVLDPALVRPGRFDRVVMVGPPDFEGRIEVLKARARWPLFCMRSLHAAAHHRQSGRAAALPVPVACRLRVSSFNKT